MPLRVRSRKGSSALWLSGTIKGRRIRESTGTSDPRVADTIRAAREAQLLEDAAFGRSPTVPFRVAADSYLNFEPRGFSQRRVVERLKSVLGHRPTRDISQLDADQARAKLLKADAMPSTVVRHIVSPLSAVLRHAAKRKWCEKPDLDWPRVEETQAEVLTPAQAEALIAAAAPHMKPLITFLFCTGARIGEALKLNWSAVDLNAGKAVFWEGTTKTRNRRVLVLPPRAIATLAALPLRSGRVFLRDDGKPYQLKEGGGGPIRSAWQGACLRAGLPSEPRPEKARVGNGQLRRAKPVHTPHDARHSWASWHYVLHKDLLRLRDEGCWRSTKMVERYAHVMPAGEEAAIRSFFGLPPASGTKLAQRGRRRA